MRTHFSISLSLSLSAHLLRRPSRFLWQLFCFPHVPHSLNWDEAKHFFNRQQIVVITYIVEGSQQFQINLVLAFNALKHIIANWFKWILLSNCVRNTIHRCLRICFFFSIRKDQANITIVIGHHWWPAIAWPISTNGNRIGLSIILRCSLHTYSNTIRSSLSSLRTYQPKIVRFFSLFTRSSTVIPLKWK